MDGAGVKDPLSKYKYNTLSNIKIYIIYILKKKKKKKKKKKITIYINNNQNTVFFLPQKFILCHPHVVSN